jgi:hypothetical protein
MTPHHDITVPAIDCTEFVLMVDELVQTEPDKWGPIVDKHLADCPPCLVYLQQMLDIQTILRHAQQGQRLADDEVERVLAAITTL